MTSMMCSAPTLLNGLDEFINSKKLEVLQIYSGNDIYRLKENRIVVFCYIGEYLRWMEIDNLLCTEKFYYDQNNKLKNYYILLTPHKHPEKLKNDYSDVCTIIECPLLYSYYANCIEKLQPSFSTNKKSHFLSLNNRATTRRQMLYYFFDKFSLRSKSYFSYIGEIKRTKFKSHDDISNICTENGNPWFLTKSKLKELNERIPITIDGDTFFENDWGYGQSCYYDDAFCSIVMETYTAEQYPFFTEKTFKPIAFFHPFILDCNPGGLALLREMGFKTFDDFWDEDYDNLRDNPRLEAIFHLILEISNWSQEKINAVYSKMMPILEHNHNHFYNVLPKMFEDKKYELFSKIKNIVKSKEELLV